MGEAVRAASVGERQHVPAATDDVIATLARRGHAIAARSLDRDFAVEHESGPAVEAAWVEIYRAWLQCRLARVVLPELWSARTAM